MNQGSQFTILDVTDYLKDEQISISLEKKPLCCIENGATIDDFVS